MDYKSRRQRRTAPAGKIERPRGPLGALIVAVVAPKKKKREGGNVEGEAARVHLGRRARGGRALDAREMANHPDGVDKVAQRSGSDERGMEMASPRKRGGRACRAEGGPTDEDDHDRFSAAMNRARTGPNRDWPANMQGADIALDRMRKARGASTKYPDDQPEGYPIPTRETTRAPGGATKWIGEARDRMDRKGTTGALHRELGVPAGEKIPEAKLEAAKHRAERTGNVKLERRVQFAENVRK